MIRDLGANKILWLLTALLSLLAALVGVLSPGIYNKVVSIDIMPGVFGQDLMTGVVFPFSSLNFQHSLDYSASAPVAGQR